MSKVMNMVKRFVGKDEEGTAWSNTACWSV